MMTGVASPRLRSSRSTSMPSRCGSPRSSSTRSKCEDCKAAPALLPSRIQSTAKDDWRSAVCRPCPIISSSSTSNTRMPGNIQLRSEAATSCLSPNRQCIEEPGRRSQGYDHGSAGEVGQAEVRGLLEVLLFRILVLIVQYFDGHTRQISGLLGFALPPFQREIMVGIGAAVEHGDDQLVVLLIVVDSAEVICTYGLGEHGCGSSGHQTKHGASVRHRCICINSCIGTMLWFRCSMTHKEPKTIRQTIRTPKARASTLFSLSGAVVMCRKKMRWMPIWATASTSSAKASPGP